MNLKKDNFKTVLITGGSSGIGLAVLDILLNQKIKVVNLDKELPNRSSENLESYQLDLTDHQKVSSCFLEIKSKYPLLDGIACIAGIGFNTPFQDVDFDTFDYQVDVNLNQVYYVIKNALEIAADPCSIVTVSSVSSFGGIGASVPYSAAKAGIIGLTKSLAWEFAHKNIRVNCVVPGAINTPLFKRLSTSTEKRLLESVTPTKKIGEPEDIAPIITFLLSDESRHIVGQSIVVDGGLSLAYKPYLL